MRGWPLGIPALCRILPRFAQSPGPWLVLRRVRRPAGWSWTAWLSYASAEPTPAGGGVPDRVHCAVTTAWGALLLPKDCGGSRCALLWHRTSSLGPHMI